jgi:hypothetical protein
MIRARQRSKPRGMPRQGVLTATLIVFAAVAMNCSAADQSPETPSASTSELIRADFPYNTDSNLPVGKSRDVGDKNFMKTAAPVAPTGQPSETTGFNVRSEGSVVRLPEFKVSAQKYTDLKSRLDQIDESISREESRTTPTKMDLILSGEKGTKFLRKFLVSFGDETAEKRARDANQKIEIFEMQRIIEIQLPFATPEDRKRLEADRESLKELSAHKLDQDPFGDPRVSRLRD